MQQEGRNYFIGVDLGQQRDFTAIAVVERLETVSQTFEWVKYARVEKSLTTTYRLRHLERVKLGTPYPQVVQRIRNVARSGFLSGRCTVVADATGVGAPVVDLLRAADLGCMVQAVTITGGQAAARSHGRWSVPKRDLIHGIRIMLETNELRAAKGLREWRCFVEEMVHVRMQMTAEGNETYGATDGLHDDLVLAVALACWGARRRAIGEVGKRLCY